MSNACKILVGKEKTDWET